MTNPTKITEPTERIDEIVAAWLESSSADWQSDRERLMKQHPDLAGEISSFFEDYERMDQEFAPLRAVTSRSSTAAEMPTMGWDDTNIQPAAQVGQTFGDYELLSEIARGGMGVVYKARQKSLNRVVALKMVLGGGRNREIERDRFLAEARAVARLTHPNIVPIYEVGAHRNQQYFTMQYLSGGSLREVIGEIQKSPREAVKLLTVIARAVEHAHRRGILHRDLKPSNVLLDDRRQPHVTDFGLAKRLDEASDLTQAGTVVGTPAYMAPEQANGQTDLSTAADVYGLGALLYELLTGQQPFKADSPLETMLLVMSQEPKPPRQHVPELDRDLETICLKCLEKDPARRYGSAESLAEDLDRWLSGEPIHARPATNVERAVKWARRQPILAGSVATTILAFLALLILSGFAWNNAELRAKDVKTIAAGKQQLAQVVALKNNAEADKTIAEKLADEQRQLADEQQKLANKIQAEVKKLEVDAKNAELRLAVAQRDAIRTLYAADMQLAHAAWLGENVAQANDLIGRYQAAAAKGQEDVRGFEWHYLHRQLNSARLSWNVERKGGGPAMFSALAVSADGKQLATAELASGSIKLWSVADGKLLRTLEVPPAKPKGLAFTNIIGLWFDDEGRQLTALVRKDFDVRAFEKMVAEALSKQAPAQLEPLAEQLSLHTISLADAGPVRSDAFDPRRLVGAVHCSLVGALFFPDGLQVIMVAALARSPDSKYLAIAGSIVKAAAGDRQRPGGVSGGKVIVWDLEKDQVHAEHVVPAPIWAVAFSAHDKRLAVATTDGAVGLADFDLKQPPQWLLGHQGFVHALRFSGDGQRLASFGADAKVRLWDVATAQEHDRLRGHVMGGLCCEFTPAGDGLCSASLDGTVKVWDLNQPQKPRILPAGTTPVVGLSLAAEGQELVAATFDGAVRKWQLPSYRSLGESPAGSSLVTGGLSVSGKILVKKENLKSDFLIKDLSSGRELPLNWKDRVPYHVAISPDDRYVATGDIANKGVSVWRVADGKQLATLDEEHGSGSTAFTRDGKTLAVSSRNGTMLWEWETNARRSIGDSQGVTSPVVEFSPDEQLLAFTTAAGLELWNVRAGQRQAICGGPGQNIRYLAFSPDGRRLAAGGTTPTLQGLLKIYDTDSGREVFAAQLPPAQVTALAFHPSGRQLFAGLAHLDPTAALTGTKVNCEIRVWDAGQTP